MTTPSRRRVAASPPPAIGGLRPYLAALLMAALALAVESCGYSSIGAVGNLQATPEGSSLVVSWTPVPGASGYDVYLDKSAAVSPSTYSSSASTSSATETIDNLTVGTTYYCVVVAYSMGGLVIGPSSEIVSVNLNGSAPGQSTNSSPIIQELTAFPGQGGQVLLAVTASDPDGDTLSYSWTVDGTAVSGNTPQLIWQGTAGSGNHTATVVVSDGIVGVSQSTSFSI